MGNYDDFDLDIKKVHENGITPRVDATLGPVCFASMKYCVDISMAVCDTVTYLSCNNSCTCAGGASCDKSCGNTCGMSCGPHC